MAISAGVGRFLPSLPFFSRLGCLSRPSAMATISGRYSDRTHAELLFRIDEWRSRLGWVDFCRRCLSFHGLDVYQGHPQWRLYLGGIQIGHMQNFFFELMNGDLGWGGSIFAVVAFLFTAWMFIQAIRNGDYIWAVFRSDTCRTSFSN